MLEYAHLRLDNGQETVRIDRHLYLTEDKSRVVEENDPEARWLWAAPGQQVSRRDAIRLGAIAPDPEPDQKQAVSPPNKQRGPVANKSGSAADEKRA
jgi:hypothetical protein